MTSLILRLLSYKKLKTNVTKAADRFQKEVEREPGSISSILLCLEIVSSLVHDITSEVYQNRHEDPEVYEKRNETPGCENPVHNTRCCPEYGRMHLPMYSWGDGLKNSWASIVGYWAESMIFGGPVLFARGSDGTEVSSILPSFVYLLLLRKVESSTC